jgi:hypothetical protein
MCRDASGNHLAFRERQCQLERRRWAGRIPPYGATKKLIDNEGLPKARPFAFSDSPRFQITPFSLLQ